MLAISRHPSGTSARKEMSKVAEHQEPSTSIASTPSDTVQCKSIRPDI